MRALLRSIGRQLSRLIHFFVSVLREFRANKGLLLASGVGYNTLLSIIPLFIVLAVGLSHIIDQEVLVATMTHELRFVVPGYADQLTEAITRFIEQRQVVGVVVGGVLLFFSSIAFRTFESALQVIFDYEPTERHLLVSVLLPYAFVGLLGLSLIALTAATAILDALSGSTLTLLEVSMTIPPISKPVIYVLSFLGLVGLFTGLYKWFPTRDISTRRAAVGALVASSLWECARRITVWWFSNISVVNVVYGSLTSVIIVLLTMEIASVIVLLGAQITAELEANAAADLPWYGDLETPDD